MNIAQKSSKNSKTGEKMSPAQRRHIWRVAAAMTAYMGSLVLAINLAGKEGPPGSAVYFLAAFSGLMLAAVFWAYVRLIMEEEDEYIRLIYVRQSLIATGLTLTLAGVWGSLEAFDLVFHLDAFLWPTVWFVGTGIAALYHWITGWYGGKIQ